MKHRVVYTLVAVAVLLSMLLAACQPAATPEPPKPTEAPKATEAPKPTEAPKATEAPAAAPEGPLNEAPDCNYGGNVKKVEAVDDMTVKITLCSPDPAFLAKIAVPAFHILDKDYLDSVAGDAAKINENPVGTGPYVLKEWVRGDHMTFEPNPNYWGKAPTIKTFILKWNKEAASRLLDLQSGNVDGIVNVGTDDLQAVKDNSELKLYPRTFNNFLYMGFQNETPPFDNEKVRQAFTMAIDREQIVKDFYPEGASAATQFLPPGVKPGFTDGYIGNKYDPEAAKKMLEEAGFDFTQEYVLSYAERTRPYFPQPTKIAQAVQAQLGEIGIKIKLDLQEWATFLPDIRAGKKPMHFLGWSEDYPDATNWYDVFLRGSNKQFGKPFDDIMEQLNIGATTADPAVRQAAYDKANTLITEHVPMTTIANGATFFAFNANVGNVVIGPYNENYSEMTNKDDKLVFSQDGEPVSLYCGDETDGSSFTACLQLFNTLYDFKWGTAEVQPALAEKCEANKDGTEWTCKLRSGVKFSNGATLDSGDVVASFVNMWNYKSPNRKGNTGVFQYWKDFFGPKALNEPAAP